LALSADALVMRSTLLVAGALGILAATWAMPGSGLAMLWTAAVAGLVGGAILVIQAFRQRKG
jgi:hypothetical protein